MTCLVCQKPITARATTGRCQPCAVAVQGARQTRKCGPQNGRSGRQHRIWAQKATALLKRMERGQP